MKFRQLITVTTTTLLLNTLSIGQTIAADKERWFEMEVILFSQLDDKNKLKEAFPDKIPLPTFNKVWDLLPAYLNPEITSLKQQLPYCESPIYPENLLTQASKLPSLFEHKTLVELENIAEQNNLLQTFNNQRNTEDLDSTENNSLVSENAVNNATSFTGSFATDTDTDNLSEKSIAAESIAAESIATDNLISELTREVESPASELELTLTDEELARILQAEQHFSDIQLDVLAQTTFAKGQTLCAIAEAKYNELALGVESSLAYNGFTLTSIPKTINAVEDLHATNPYLLNNDSLKLHDIVKQLRRSKNFRPLLHIGWRQAPKGRNKSIPVKLFAGENFADNYQKAQQAYLTAKEVSQVQEQLLENILLSSDADDSRLNNQTLSDDGSNSTLLTPEAQQEVLEQQAMQTRIEQILEEIDSAPTNVQEIVETIDHPNLKLMAEDDSLMLDTPPVSPPQPWFLEGFFNVHLNHYLYITADFNVLNMDLAQYATQQLQPQTKTELKPIRFQQNRRVISGEIHYFDHPYMGMIVQIRRHKRPEPQEKTTIDSE